MRYLKLIPPKTIQIISAKPALSGAKREKISEFTLINWSIKTPHPQIFGVGIFHSSYFSLGKIISSSPRVRSFESLPKNFACAA
jgi:hypothetical protein